jgi:hypothetical protein
LAGHEIFPMLNCENSSLSGIAAERRILWLARMPAAKSMKKIWRKVRRALRNGTMPIEIARELGIPLLLVAEIAIWEMTLRDAQGGS